MKLDNALMKADHYLAFSSEKSVWFTNLFIFSFEVYITSLADKY